MFDIYENSIYLYQSTQDYRIITYLLKEMQQIMATCPVQNIHAVYYIGIWEIRFLFEQSPRQHPGILRILNEAGKFLW